MGLGSGSSSSMAAAWQRPMALPAGRMQLSCCGSQGQPAQGSQQHLHLQHQLQSQGFTVSGRRPGTAAGSFGLLVQRKLGPLLAISDDELEITCVQELADGSMFFSFGGSAPPQLGKRMEELGSCRAELVATPAPLHLPQRAPSHFTRNSPIPVLAARRKMAGRKVETEVGAVDAGAASNEVGMQVATPSVRVGRSRPASTFEKRSPVPEGTAQRRKSPSEPGRDAVGIEIPTRSDGEVKTLVPPIYEEQVHVTTKGAVEHAPLVQVDIQEQELVTADIPRIEESVEGAPVVQVESYEQEALVSATGSVVSKPKSADKTRRRTSRKAAKSDREASSETRHSDSLQSTETPQALVTQTPAQVPARAPSKFVRRSPIPAASQNRSVRASPVVALAVSKEISVVKETVVQETSAKGTAQARTSVGRSPSKPAAVVIAASVALEQAPSRPKSSFVRRSPISRRDNATVGGALDRSQGEEEEAVAAEVIPKPGSPARSRTKPASSKPVAQLVTSPAVDAPTPIAIGLDSESENYNRSPESNAAAPGDRAAPTIQQLRTIAKGRGLKGYSKLKKSELIELLQSGGTGL